MVQYNSINKVSNWACLYFKVCKLQNVEINRCNFFYKNSLLINRDFLSIFATLVLVLIPYNYLCYIICCLLMNIDFFSDL